MKVNGRSFLAAVKGFEMLKGLIALAAVEALAAAAPSAATVYTLSVSGSISTYPGFLADEHDRSGLFRPAGASLAGLPFQLDYRIDTSLLRLSGTTPTSKYYQSGSLLSPPVGDGITASIRIGGTLVRHIGERADPSNAATGVLSDAAVQSSIGNAQRHYVSMQTRSNANNQSALYYVNGRGHLGLKLGANIYLSNNAEPSILLLDGNANLTPFNLHFAEINYNIAQGDLVSYNGSTGQFDAFYFDIRDASLSAAPAGVPEPASWALLIAGFGLTGAVMRRRRSPATVAA